MDSQIKIKFRFTGSERVKPVQWFLEILMRGNAYVKTLIYSQTCYFNTVNIKKL